MKVSLPYGSDTVEFTVPDGRLQAVYRPHPVAACDSPREEIERAIDHPIGSPGLDRIVFPGCSVCIVCDDITRPTPTATILEVLVPKLLALGADPDRLKVVLALGSHRDMTEAEMIQKVGEPVFRRFPVLNSQFRDRDALVDLGRTADGVEIWASRAVMDSDVRIGLGNIVPHPAMGWSGGGKIIYPGVTGEETVAKFHVQHGLAGINMFGMEDCPVRLTMEKWVDTVGLHFIVNTVLTPERALYKAVAGHYVAAHREGVRHARTLYGRKAVGTCDVAVVGSCPVDIDFWQATKGVLCGDPIVADGGTLILVTPCFEGVGPHREYIGQIGNDDAERMLRESEATGVFHGDPLALAIGTTISRIRKRIRLSLVSGGITREESGIAKFEYSDTVQEALDLAMARYRDPKVSVVTHGGELSLYL